MVPARAPQEHHSSRHNVVDFPGNSGVHVASKVDRHVPSKEHRSFHHTVLVLTVAGTLLTALLGIPAAISQWKQWTNAEPDRQKDSDAVAIAQEATKQAQARAEQLRAEGRIAEEQRRRDEIALDQFRLRLAHERRATTPPPRHRTNGEPVHNTVRETPNHVKKSPPETTTAVPQPVPTTRLSSTPPLTVVGEYRVFHEKRFKRDCLGTLFVYRDGGIRFESDTHATHSVARVAPEYIEVLEHGFTIPKNLEFPGGGRHKYTFKLAIPGAKNKGYIQERTATVFREWNALLRQQAALR